MENKKDGFRVGNFFCVLPDGEFIQEDRDGETYISLEIYRIEKDNSMSPINQNEIIPEIEDMINEEINNMLLAAINEEFNKEVKNVKD